MTNIPNAKEMRDIAMQKKGSIIDKYLFEIANLITASANNGTCHAEAALSTDEDVDNAVLAALKALDYQVRILQDSSVMNDTVMTIRIRW